MAFGVGFLDFLNDGVEFLAAGFEDLVVFVHAGIRAVRRDGQHVELVDVVELGRLGFGGAGHAGELFVKPEIVLNRDRGEGLGFLFDLDAFLGFDRLVEAIGPTPAGHFAAGVFIDDDDFAFLDDVLDVLFVNAVGLEELGNVVDFLRLGIHPDLQGVLGRDALLVGQLQVGVDVREQRAKVGQGERLGIAGGEEFAAHFHEVGVVAFLVDDEIEFLLEGEKFLFLGVLMEGQLGFLDEAADFRFLHEAEELAVAGLAEFEFEDGDPGGHRIAGFEQGFGLSGEVVAEFGLLFDELLDERLVFVELMGRLGGRAGNDERGAGFVDKDGVHFVDDGEVVAALDLFVAGGGHPVVAEIVEAKLGVGAVGHVAAVFRAAFPRRHLVLDATHGEAEVAEQGPHPLGVAAGEVVVDGDHMDAQAGEGVEVNGQGGDEGFAFPGLHFRDHAAVQGDATDELAIEVDHFPIKRLIAHAEGGAAEAAGGGFDDRVGLREDAFEVFDAARAEFGLDVMEGGLGGFDRRRGGLDHGGQGREFVAQRGEALFEEVGGGPEFLIAHALDHRLGRRFEDVVAGQMGLPFGGHFAEFLLRFAVEGFLDLIDAGNRGTDAAKFALVLAANDFLENPLDHVRDGVRRECPRGAGNTPRFEPVQALAAQLEKNAGESGSGRAGGWHMGRARSTECGCVKEQRTPIRRGPW